MHYSMKFEVKEDGNGLREACELMVRCGALRVVSFR